MFFLFFVTGTLLKFATYILPQRIWRWIRSKQLRSFLTLLPLPLGVTLTSYCKESRRQILTVLTVFTNFWYYKKGCNASGEKNQIEDLYHRLKEEKCCYFEIYKNFSIILGYLSWSIWSFLISIEIQND